MLGSREVSVNEIGPACLAPSHPLHAMPPRITRNSHRPRASPETSSRVYRCNLETQFHSFLSEELDLLLPVSLFVVLGTFVNVALTVLQHSVDESSESVGHRGNGFRGTE